MWLFKKKRYLRYKDVYGKIVSMRIIEEASSYYKIKGRLSSEEELVSGRTYRTSTLMIAKRDPRIINIDGQSANVHYLNVRMRLPAPN